MSRLDDLVGKLVKNQLDAVWLSSKANFYYFSDYYTEPHERIIGIFVDRKGEPVAVLPSMEKAQLLKAGWKGTIVAYSDEDNPLKLLYQLLSETNRIPDKLAVEKDQLTIRNYQLLAEKFPAALMEDASSLLADLRMIKDKKECSLLKQAAQLADYGVEIGIASIQEGKTELEIVAEIEFALKKQGIREMAFSTMVLAGENSSSPHGNPGRNQIKSGDLVLFDLGVVFEGYCSDITRTIAYKSVNEEQRRIYETVHTAQQKAIDQATVGNAARQLDHSARSYISSSGYGDYFLHRIGHGIGIEVHEHPSLHGTSEITLQEGMTFTIEPGIYVPGSGGVRIEDQLFLTKKGPEILTRYPKELIIV